MHLCYYKPIHFVLSSRLLEPAQFRTFTIVLYFLSVKSYSKQVPYKNNQLKNQLKKKLVQNIQYNNLSQTETTDLLKKLKMRCLSPTEYTNIYYFKALDTLGNYSKNCWRKNLLGNEQRRYNSITNCEKRLPLKKRVLGKRAISQSKYLILIEDFQLEVFYSNPKAHKTTRVFFFIIFSQIRLPIEPKFSQACY